MPAHPLFTAGSDPAESLGESKPVSLDAPKIVYSAEDDKAIDDNARQFGGLCPMLFQRLWTEFLRSWDDVAFSEFFRWLVMNVAVLDVLQVRDVCHEAAGPGWRR